MANSIQGYAEERKNGIYNRTNPSGKCGKQRRLRLLVATALVTSCAAAIVLSFSAFPVLETRSLLSEFGDISNNGSGLIEVDSRVSAVEITLVQPRLRSDLNVSIMASLSQPPISLTTLKTTIQIDAPLQKRFRAGCNCLSNDEPIYLLSNSSLQYNMDSHNRTVVNRLCFFDNSHEYTEFLTNYTFEPNSRSHFCFNISGSSSAIVFTVNRSSLYYAAVDTPGNTDIFINMTIFRYYYDARTSASSLATACTLSDETSSCVTSICDGYLCQHSTNYIIVESSEHVTLKFDTFATFYVTPTLRIILFSLSMFLELIAGICVITCLSCWKCHGSQQTQQNAQQLQDRSKTQGVFAATLVLITLCLHLTAVAFITNYVDKWSVSSNITIGIGNKHPVLLNPPKFMSVSNIEITWSFPNADSISVHKVPCKNLKTSSSNLPTVNIQPLNVSRNSRHGINYNNYSIPLNLAPGSTLSYIIRSSGNTFATSSTNSAINCIRLVLMKSIDAYSEFLTIPYTTSFKNYVSRSDCLPSSGISNFNFSIKHEQSDYYVGIESPYDITVTAEVSVVQVYYDLNNTVKVCRSLSIYNPSCNITLCKTYLCIDESHTCILVDSTSFDVISYTSYHNKFLTNTTSFVLIVLAIFCASILILLLLFTGIFCCVRSKESVKETFKKMAPAKKKRKYCLCLCIVNCASIALAFSFIPIIVLDPGKLSGKAWIESIEDFVFVDLEHKGKWFGSHSVTFSVENGSNAANVSLYSVSCSNLLPRHRSLINTSKIECLNFSSYCILNESVYLVKTTGVYVNYSLSVFSSVTDLPFHVSVFDDYAQYESFRNNMPYIPLTKSISYNAAPSNDNSFNFSFSYSDMQQRAAYYHFVLHPPFHSEIYQLQYSKYTSYSYGKMISDISYYDLSDYTPQYNLTNTTTIHHIKDNDCIVAKALELSEPVVLSGTSSDNQSSYVIVVIICTFIAIVLSIIVALILISRFRSDKSYNGDDHRHSGLITAAPARQRSRFSIGSNNIEELDPLLDNATGDELANEDDYSEASATQKETKKNQPNIELIASIFDKEAIVKLEFDSNGLVHYSPQYGVTLIIPKGAVQKSSTVWFAVCLYSDKFQCYDYIPVTPIVWVYIDEELRKPAELYLPHHIDAKSLNCTTDTFAILKADDQDLLKTGPATLCTAQFPECKLHNIWRSSSIFKVSAKHFCSTCVAKKEPPVSQNRFLAISAIKREEDKVFVNICFLFRQECCRKLIESQYESSGYIINEKSQKTFSFKENSHQLSLTFNGLTTWYCESSSPTVITKDQIDYQKIFEEKGDGELKRQEQNKEYPPRFSIIFKKYGAMSESEDKNDVKICISGTREELEIPFELIEDELTSSANLPSAPIQVTDLTEKCLRCIYMWEAIKFSRSYKALDYFRENHHLCETCLNKLPQKNTYTMSYMEDENNGAHQANSCTNFSDDYSEEDDGIYTKDEQATDELQSHWLLLDDLKMLMIELKDIAAHYKTLGRYLYIPREIIDKIEEEHSTEPSNALQQMLSNWLTWKIDYVRKGNDEKPSRKWLLAAVDKIDASLAKKLADNAKDAIIIVVQGNDFHA